MSNSVIIVLNCGSSSIKFAVFEAAMPVSRKPLWNGKVQGIGGPCPDFGESGVRPFAIALGAEHPYRDALRIIRERIAARLGDRPVAAIAHRVVHGGSKYFASTRIDAQVLKDLRSYVPLAPLHQPFALEAMEILLRERPDIAQIACFDTGFHHSLPKVEQILPLPYEWWQRGVRRYGFHGLSYAYMATALAERHGDRARGRTIVAHLGSGASLCGMQQLQSMATTMGFSALDGLMMGTRTGALDPGAVLYLMEIEKLTLQELGRLLYHDSGLLGMSGVSSEPRVILRHVEDPGESGERARIALDLFVRRIVREIGSLAAALGGLDMLVFTAGIGEHSGEIRARVCADLAWLGLALDVQANAAHAPVISAAGSRVLVGVEPTNEEWVAGRDTMRILAQSTTA